MRFLTLIILSVIILRPISAGAQQPLVLETLTEWNNAAPVPPTATLINEVMKSAVSALKGKGGCLPSSAAINSVLPATGVRFVMQGIARRQIKNAWTLVVHHPNCGVDVTRYAVVRQSDDSLYAFRINQGRSNANESLIGDTFPMAILAATLALKRAGTDCDGTDATLGVTRIVEESPDLGAEIFGIRYKGYWREVWPVTTCGRTAEVSVRFMPDGDGGAHHNMEGNAIKILPAIR